MLLKKKYRLLRSKLNILLGKDVLFPENKILLEEFCKYKKAVILGSAPSVGSLDLEKFSKTTLIISMGNFHEHKDIKAINPHIHAFAASHDPLIPKVLKNWWIRCHEKLPEKTIVLLENKDRKIAEEVFANRKFYTYSYGGTYPVDFTKKIVSPWSVTQIALQLCINLRIKETYILGVNHDWQSCKPYTHFFKHSEPSLEYYLHQEGISTRNEQLKQPMPKEKMYRSYELYQSYELLKRESEKLDLKIYNGDPYSSFDVFEKRIMNNLIIP